jgi:uncharacterized protein YjbI with pentapeptide repeats
LIEQQRREAGVHLEGSTLRGTHLEGARLRGAHLAQAVLPFASLRCADLTYADLQGASLGGAHLEGADLNLAHMEGAGLGFAHLEGAALRGAQLGRASLANARLDGADLTRAHLEGTRLFGAHLEGAHLLEAELTGADLGEAHLEGANLHEVRLEGADLTRAYLDSRTHFSDPVLGGVPVRRGPFRAPASPAAKLRDVHWGGVDVTLVQWGSLLLLGDEQQARLNTTADGYRKPRDFRVLEFEHAVRANRQLATVLRDQGFNEHADRFGYRALVCQREVLRRQRTPLRFLGSLLLDAIAGYGYRPLRSLIAYFVIILAFAGAYLLNAQFAAPHLTWDESLVLSISSFHGRGFITSGVSLGDTLARLAAGEAIVGLLIEITFIATFTQRFFAR